MRLADREAGVAVGGQSIIPYNASRLQQQQPHPQQLHQRQQPKATASEPAACALLRLTCSLRRFSASSARSLRPWATRSRAIACSRSMFPWICMHHEQGRAGQV